MQFKIFILLFCLIYQINTVALAENDITQSADYKAIMDRIRNSYTEQSTNSKSQEEKPQKAGINKNNTSNNEAISITNFKRYYEQEIDLYNRIISKYNAINVDYNNQALYTEYIKTVEDYLNTYSDISLKSQNIYNYYLIIKRLGYAYEKLNRINEAISAYETIVYEIPTDLNVKKNLLKLYNDTKNCTQAKNILSEIRLYEPNYNVNLTSCELKKQVNNTNNIIQYDTTPIPMQTDSIKEYDWTNVYIIYFGFWVLLLMLCLNINDNETNNSEYNYNIRYDYNNYPIQPEIYEFGFNKDSFEKIKNKLNSIDNSILPFFLFAPLSMWFITSILSAPNIIFPVFRSGNGIILGLVFWVISSYVINTLKNKIDMLINNQNIKKYEAYQKALQKYEYEQQLIEEKKKKEYERKQREKKEYWYNLDPYQFEEQIGELCKNLGCKVIVTQKSNDGGIDVIIEKENKKMGIQCKRYKGKVGVQEVQQLWGAKEYFKLNNKKIKIDGVIMVALSGVTRKAKEFIHECAGYELWTIDTILDKAKEANYNY